MRRGEYQGKTERATEDGRATPSGVEFEPVARVGRIRLVAVAGVLGWAGLSGALFVGLHDSPPITGIVGVTFLPMLVIPPLLVVIARKDDSKAYRVLPDRVEFVSRTGDVRAVERAEFGLVELRQGPLQRLTGVASIVIDLDVGDGKRVKMSDVPGPDDQYERLRPEWRGQTIRPRAAVGIVRAAVTGSIVVAVFVWLFLALFFLPVFTLLDAVAPTLAERAAPVFVAIHGGIVPATLVGGTIRNRRTEYRIANRYVERRVDGLVRRRRGFAVLDNVRGVDHERGPVDALFGTGTVQIRGPNYRYDHDGPDRGDLKLRGLDRHEAIYDRLAGTDPD